MRPDEDWDQLEETWLVERGKTPGTGWKRAPIANVEFTEATHAITVDRASGTTTVRSTLAGKAGDDGAPWFELVPNPAMAWLKVGTNPETPVETRYAPNARVRLVDGEVKNGDHVRLRTRHEIRRGVAYEDDGVVLRLGMSDVEERGLLERYLPTPLEPVAYRLTVEVTVVDAVAHAIFANVPAIPLGPNRWSLTMEEANSAALFLHVLPALRVVETSRQYTRADGEPIKVRVYADSRALSRGWGQRDAGSRVERVADMTLDGLRELEELFGAPYPHDDLLVHLLDQSSETPSMEYRAAVEADEGSLLHELVHCWFGRGLTPSEPNALWFDEAVATWVVQGCEALSQDPKDKATKMGLLGPHERWTPRAAYGVGGRVLARLQGLAQKNEAPVLRDALRMLLARPRRPISAGQIRKALHADRPGAKRLLAKYLDEAEYVVPVPEAEYRRALRTGFSYWQLHGFHRVESLGKAPPEAQPPVEPQPDLHLPLLGPDRAASAMAHLMGHALWRATSELDGPARDTRAEETIREIARFVYEPASGEAKQGPRHEVGSTAAQGLDLAPVLSPDFLGHLLRFMSGGAQPIGDGSWVSVAWNGAFPLVWGVNLAYRDLSLGDVIRYVYGEVSSQNGIPKYDAFGFWDLQQPAWNRFGPAQSQPQTFQNFDQAKSYVVASYWSPAAAQYGYSQVIQLARRSSLDG